MNKRIGILVVAYNAESTLASVLERIPQEIVDKVEEIFIFDDASQDDTLRVGREFDRCGMAGKLTVRRNNVNRMYGGNQKLGYQYAIERGLDIVVLLHGDGQYAPEVMQRLLDPLERDEAELVMGSRMMEAGAARRGGMPRYKYVGNRLLTAFQNLVTGAGLSEFHSGYRAYAVQSLRAIDLGRLTDSWHFDTQIILELSAQHGRVVEVPIPTYYGDEICYVNGLPYAWNCVKTTLAHAWRGRLRRYGAIRPSHPPIE